MEYNFQEIERKWQKRWEKEKVFYADPDKREKFFINFPYPYINAYLHLGHGFSSIRVDVMARFKRMQGYNVLFPQAWHCTGTPVWAASKRVKEKEPKQIKILENMGFSKTEIKKFEDPKHWIDVFVPAAKEDFIRTGNSVDWRRSFITTDLNPRYDKFIRWQFRKLQEKNLIEKGEHPVVWDPKINMPVGDHDRIEGEGEVPQEFCLFKFSLDDGRKLVSATLRPDTVKGITNLYVNPKVTYIVAEVNDEIWIVSKPIIEKLKNQGFSVADDSEDINGRDLVGKYVEFFKGKKILVLPADFLDPNYGTGIVHSVPSDSTDDLMALRNLQTNKSLIKEYGLNEEEVKKIKPIPIFETPGVKGDTAQYFLDKYNVKSLNEKNKLEEIKKELYKLTFNKSVLGPLYAKGFSQNLEGVPVSQAQAIIKADLLKEGKINLFYELTGRVVSRSLAECIVKIVSDQWFIKYGDKNWKKKVHDAVDKMKFYPDLIRQQFDYVIDWLNDWACTHHQGMGTRLPWDEKWVIESLSDSTIYMAYYTIAHLIKDYPEGKIDDEFFDYVLLGEGKGDKEMQDMRKEFEYWYPFDIRSSGKDLVQNHLSFSLFNHTAIFPEKYWPKAFSVNGWLLVEGEKMSKSKGNFYTIREILEKYPADVMRASLMLGGEGVDDPNFDFRNAENIKQKLQQWYEFSLSNYKKSKNEKNTLSDNVFLSYIHKILKEGTFAMESMLFRTAFDRLFYQMQKGLREYISRGKINQKILNEFIEIQTKVISPFCPHIAEELWDKLGNKEFISLAKWPKFDETKINENFEKEGKIIDKIADDINSIQNLFSKEGKKAKIVYVYSIPNQKKLLDDNIEFLRKKTQLEIKIYLVNDKDKYDPQEKSKRAKPGKPALFLE
jgi:leucyl-tRNA synthetase